MKLVSLKKGFLFAESEGQWTLENIIDKLPEYK